MINCKNGIPSFIFHSPPTTNNNNKGGDSANAPNITLLLKRGENFAFLCLVDIYFSSENDEEKAKSMKKCVEIASFLLEVGKGEGVCERVLKKKVLF